MRETAIAATPVLAALVLLLVLRRSASVAGGVACVLALAASALEPAFGLPAERLGLAVLRGLLVALLVAYIVFFGLLLYHLMARGRAMERLVHDLARLVGERAVRTLLLCLPLGAFFEAASGFGVGIVIVAPWLLALGYAPWRAAVLALLTQNAVPWGALAVGTILGSEIAGLPSATLGLGSAYLSLALFPYFTALALVLAGGVEALVARWRLGLACSVLMGLAAWAGTRLLGVELAFVVGGPLVAGAMLLGVRRGVAPCSGSNADDAGLPETHRALAPYGALVLGLLASRLVGPLREWLLSSVVLAVPAAGVSLAPVYSPGFWLALGCATAIRALRLSGGACREELWRTWRRWVPATVALAAFLVLSELMLQSGMTDRLATAAASVLGRGYALAAPLVGGLGGFLTGSNAAGNAMFMAFQLRMAEQLGAPPLVFAAAQNTAGAALSLASPQRVVLATAVVGLAGKEGDLMRAALLICAGVVALVAASEVIWLLALGAV